MSAEIETVEPLDHPPEDDLKMTIWDHLSEFRSRIFRAAIALVITTGVCWAFHTRLLGWLIRPYEIAWVAHEMPGKAELQTLSPADAFIGYMQLSLVGGIIFAAPVIFYQLWAFISPGLYAREKRYIIPFVVFSTGLFLAGVAFAYYAAFPLTFGYFFTLLGVVTEGGTALTQRPTLEFYLDFTTTMLLGFGFVFELPLFITFMAMAGIVTPRQLVKFTRWAILVSFIVGAIVTPGPDITSQLVVSIALVILYLMSVGLSFIVAPKRLADDDKA